MNKLTIVMYHYVRDLKHSRYPAIKGMSTDCFSKQISYLKDCFSIVTIEEVINAYENKNILPDKATLLTFDDGYSDHFLSVFPILEKYGVQGSFFIPGKTFTEHKLLDVNKIHYILASADINKLSADLKDRMDFYRGSEYDYPGYDELYEQYAKETRFDNRDVVFFKRMLQTVLPEKIRNIISSFLFEKYVGVSEETMAYELYMTEDQIMTMKRHGMYIGIHGYDHYWLGNLPEDKMKQDIDMALRVMDEFIDKDQWVMNYPYGNYNEKVLEYVKSKGACLGLSTEVRVADLNKDNLLMLPRLDCNDVIFS